MADRDSQKLPNQLVAATGAGLIITAACTTGQTVDILKNTTLNEKRGILAEESLGRKNGRNFYLQYFGVGIKGSRSIGEDPSGLEGRRVYQHKAIDQAAFYSIPMIARKMGDDLDPIDRDKYRMRYTDVINGETWIFYDLKLAGFAEFDPTVKVGERDPLTGEDTERPYTPKEEDLSPKPYELVSTDSVPITNTYINGTGKMDLSLDANDLAELRNVCSVLFGDPGKAAINELYVAFGIETTNQGQTSATTTTDYKEVMSATVAYHITEAYARDANANSQMPWYFWLGNSIPLLVGAEAIVGG
jgi:hypothetical protein